jgi:hypothetical protein
MKKLVALKDLQPNMNKYTSEVKAIKSFIRLKQSELLFKIMSNNEDSGWEEVINFVKIINGGVNINKLLAIL